MIEPEPGPGADLVARAIQAELTYEAERKASLEARGNVVITTSGTLVTLMLALAALVTAQDKYQAPSPALIAILVALVFFVAAAVLGILTNTVSNYERVNVADIEDTFRHQWHSITLGEAKNLTVESNLDVLKSAREKADSKAVLLRWAVMTEVGAVAALAVAVAIVILSGL